MEPPRSTPDRVVITGQPLEPPAPEAPLDSHRVGPRSSPAEKAVSDLRHELRNKLSVVRNAVFYLRRRSMTTALWNDDPRMSQFFSLIDDAITASNVAIDERLNLGHLIGEPLARVVAPASVRPACDEPPPGRVLLVDDDASNHLTLSILLEDEGLHVDIAVSFAEAKGILLSGVEGYDLVLLDQHLGDGEGSDLLPIVREKMPAARAILVSGSLGADERAHLVGFDALLVKGTPLPELLAVIRRSIGAAPTQRNPGT